MSIAKPKSRTYRVLARFLKSTVLLAVKRRWEGAENLPEGGFIVAANHVSTFDPLTAAHSLYDNGRAPVIMAKSSLFKVPVLGWVLRRTEQIPVYRGTSDARKALESAATRLQGGDCVLVFPEGTLTKDPNLWPMIAKTGVARLALTSQQPVIPLAQWGAHKIMPQRAKFLRLIPRKPVHIIIGKPVDLSDLYGLPIDAAVLREATNRVMNAITNQLEVIRGEKAPSQAWDTRTARPAEGESE